MSKTKAQISIEYMLVIGFVTLTLIPLLAIYFIFTQDSNDSISASQLDQVANRIVDTSESMYYLGSPSQTTITAVIPESISSVNLTGNEVVFRFSTKNGNSEIVKNTNVNITGSLPESPGTYKILIMAKEGYVEVSYT